MHPSQDRLLGFLRGDEPEETAERVYAHLDDCEPCRERCAALQRLQADFDGSWEAFLAELRHRLAGPTPATGLVARALVNAGRRVATLAAQQVQSLDALVMTLVPRPLPHGVGSPGESVHALDDEAKQQLAAGDAGAALARLDRVAARAPEHAASHVIDILAGDERVGQIAVDARRRSLSVWLGRVFLAGRTATVVLHSSTGPERTAPLSPVEGATYELTEFEPLDDGIFDIQILFEPR